MRPSPGRVGTYIGFEPALSQEIYAGADAFIMPSKSEPCGLAQMVACRYGTPPIIRETGGLRDSIHDCTLGEGNGFTFAGYSAHELYDACCRAQDRYYSKEDWHNLVKYDMECDFSWDVSAKSYEGLYNETANLCKDRPSTIYAPAGTVLGTAPAGAFCCLSAKSSQKETLFLSQTG